MTNDADWARPLVHWDLQARDPEKQRAFYRDLFGWSIGEGPIMSIDPGIGGPEPGPGGHIIASDQPGFGIYVQVRDLQASLERAEQLGALAVGRPFDVPGGPTIAPITDPEGNRVVLVQQ